MKSKAYSNIFPFFAVSLVLYFYYMTEFWWVAITSKETSTGSMGLSAGLLLIFSFTAISLGIRHLKLNGIFIVCFLWIIMMPIVIFLSKGKPSDYVLTLLWPALFCTSYILVYRDVSFLSVFRAIFLAFFVYGIILFVNDRLMSVKQTNVVYLSIFIIPWILSFKKFRIYILLLFLLIALFSMKRSLILAVSLTWLFYFLEIFRGKSNKLVAVIFIIVFSFIALGVFSYTNSYTGNAIMERLEREETDEGRNRLAIYEVTLSMISNSDITELLTGHGHYGVYNDSILKISAHNDFLECIYDYGIFIFLLYLFLWYYLINRCVYLYKTKSDLFLPYIASFSLFLVQSLFEHMLLYTSWLNYLVILWGSTEAIIRRKENLKKWERAFHKIRPTAL